MPDLHPGKWGPVGCSILADRIHPPLVGSDIGCSMGLFQLDLPVRKLRIDTPLPPRAIVHDVKERRRRGAPSPETLALPGSARGGGRVTRGIVMGPEVAGRTSPVPSGGEGKGRVARADGRQSGGPAMRWAGGAAADDLMSGDPHLLRKKGFPRPFRRWGFPHP